MVVETEEADGEANAGGRPLPSLWLAPQRCLAHMQPTQTLVDKMSHLMTYCVDLSLDPRKGCKDFGEPMRVESEDLRAHVVLPWHLEILVCVRKSNKQGEKLEQDLEVQTLRDRTDAQHLNKCDMVEAALAWMMGEQAHSLPSEAD